jgi:hypothetical protein
MKDESETKKQLMNELVKLRKRINKMERSETERTPGKNGFGSAEAFKSRQKNRKV